jgi:hypothetical protein
MLINIIASYKQRKVIDKNNIIIYYINAVQLLNSEYMQLNNE